MRSRQHLQKLLAGFSTCRAAGALPVKTQFHAQLGMCQPASRRENAWRFNPRFHSPACATLTRSSPFQSHLRQLASPCSLSTLQNAPPLFLLQTNPNMSVSGLRCHGERSEPLASKSAQRRVRVKARTLPRKAPRFEKPGFDPLHCHTLASLPAKPTFILQHICAFQAQFSP